MNDSVPFQLLWALKKLKQTSLKGSLSNFGNGKTHVVGAIYEHPKDCDPINFEFSVHL
jgi:hypothetical protein